MHESKPFFGVQFHPEVGPGPTDTEVCQKDEVYYILKFFKIRNILMWKIEKKNKYLGGVGTKQS